MFKAFLVIFSYVTSYEFKNLVEMAGVEPTKALLYQNLSNISTCILSTLLNFI